MDVTKLAVVVHICKSKKAEGGRAKLQDHPWLHIQFKANLS